MKKNGFLVVAAVWSGCLAGVLMAGSALAGPTLEAPVMVKVDSLDTKAVFLRVPGESGAVRLPRAWFQAHTPLEIGGEIPIGPAILKQGRKTR